MPAYAAAIRKYKPLGTDILVEALVRNKNRPHIFLGLEAHHLRPCSFLLLTTLVAGFLFRPLQDEYGSRETDFTANSSLDKLGMN